jgi:hypothetical protein
MPAIAANAQIAMSLPSNAKAGECYARVVTAPTFETKTERIVKREASARVEVIPASFDQTTERVLVKEGGEKIVIVDENGMPYTGSRKPTVRTLQDGTIEVESIEFETVTERVLVREAYDKLEVVPAVYETQSDRVMVAPARTEWKPSEGRIYGNAVRDGSGTLVTKATEAGQLMCLVEIPAEYRTVTKRTLKSPATHRAVAVPAEYRTITRRIPKKLFTKIVKTDPVYETISKRVVKMAAREVRHEIPAEYETITSRVKVSDGDVTWMPVLCEVNVTNATVMQIQRALAAKGHRPGSVDGVWGAQTATAIAAFQQANGLATGELTLETIERLGVEL